MKRFLLRNLCIILILSIGVTGCWDRRELEDRELVIAMAVDSENRDLRVTTQVPIPAAIVGRGGSGGSEGKSTMNFDAKGETLSAALDNMERKLNKNLFLGYLEVVLFGEEKARAGIGEQLDYLRRDTEVQRNLYPIVVRGKGSNLLDHGTEMEQIQAVFLPRMINVGSKQQTVMPARLNDLLITLSTPSREVPILNYFGLEDGQYKWLGFAVFKGDKMRGVLTPDETVPLLHIREKYRGKKILTPCPKGVGSIQFMPLKLKQKVRVNPGPSLHIDIEIEGNISEKTCSQVVKWQKREEIVAKKIENTYQQLANRLVHKAQKEWKLDIFNLGDFVRAFYPSVYKQVNWKKDFPNIPIDVSYRVYVRRSGANIR